MEFIRRARFSSGDASRVLFYEGVRKPLILLRNSNEEIFPITKRCCGNFATLVFFDQVSVRQSCRFAHSVFKNSPDYCSRSPVIRRVEIIWAAQGQNARLLSPTGWRSNGI
jgi:hypothetical protein